MRVLPRVECEHVAGPPTLDLHNVEGRSNPDAMALKGLQSCRVHSFGEFYKELDFVRVQCPFAAVSAEVTILRGFVNLEVMSYSCIGVHGPFLLCSAYVLGLWEGLGVWYVQYGHLLSEPLALPLDVCNGGEGSVIASAIESVMGTGMMAFRWRGTS